MKRNAFLSTALALTLQFCSASSAAAHGGTPRLELDVAGSYPGGAVQVRGVDFEPDEAIELSLIGPLEIPLGRLTADAEGGFLQLFSLPADLPEGEYRFRAVTDDHEVFSPPLAVTALLMPGEQREQEESLLVPMPTSPPPAAGSASASKPALPRPLYALLALIALALAWLLLRRSTNPISKI